MRTRTLLFLAIGCGAAILLAGMFLLLKLDHQTTTPLLGVGAQGRAGDAVVTVVKVDEQPSTLVVTVTLSGVDDAQGIKGFSLIAPNRRLAPAHGAADECKAFTVQPATCTLTFDTGALQGTGRQLLFERAAERLRWKLVA